MAWMDWNRAIETNRQALKRILAALVAMAGLSIDPQGASLAKPGVLPRRLRNAVLRLLRPAEAATRRLVIVAARDLKLPPLPPRPRKPLPAYIEIPANAVARNGRTGIVVPEGTLRRIGRDGNVVYLLPQPQALALPAPRSTRKARTGFALFDPLRNPFPRRSTAGPHGSRRNGPRPFGPRAAEREAVLLALRMSALGAALDNLDGQARRYARWRDRAPSCHHVRRIAPIRSSRPPGWRRPGAAGSHDVHGVLDATHGLALWAMEPPRRDSS